MLAELCNDRITLVKADGSTVSGVKAHVSGSSVIVLQTNLPLERGDKILRRMPSGIDEAFIVVRPNFFAGHENIPPHYQIEVEQAMEINFDSRPDERSPALRIKPIFSDPGKPSESSYAFVLMPFDEVATLIYREIIQPAVEECGIMCRRADEFASNRAVMDDVWSGIFHAQCVIADVTEFNPNVMYELGISHTVGRPTVIIYMKNSRVEERFPFDFVHIRRIEYENTAVGGRSLHKQLKALIKHIDQREQEQRR